MYLSEKTINSSSKSRNTVLFTSSHAGELVSLDYSEFMKKKNSLSEEKLKRAWSDLVILWKPHGSERLWLDMTEEDVENVEKNVVEIDESSM